MNTSYEWSLQDDLDVCLEVLTTSDGWEFYLDEVRARDSQINLIDYLDGRTAKNLYVAACNEIQQRLTDRKYEKEAA